MRKLCCLAAAAAIALLLMLIAVDVYAHERYTGQVDPVYQGNCCGGSDCADAPEGSVSMSGSGFKVVMNIDQAKTVNPLADSGIAAIVPWNRVQPSWDEKFHICIYPSNRAGPRNGVICFWAPATT